MDDDHDESAQDRRDLRRRRACIHAALVLAVVVCPVAFAFELWRALSGNTLSWAYVVEWPFFLGVTVYFWVVMLRQETGAPRRGAAPEPVADDDAELIAWRRYLEEAEAEEGTGRVAEPPAAG